MDLVSNEIERMAENGTATFANPGDYQAGIGDASVDLIVTGGGDFNARLTWLSLRRLHVLRASENLPRIAFLSLSPGGDHRTGAASGQDRAGRRFVGRTAISDFEGKAE
jgi:hypothetical protein